MFNYFACRKIAETELNTSLNDLIEIKNQEKFKRKLPTTISRSIHCLLNSSTLLMCKSV